MCVGQHPPTHLCNLLELIWIKHVLIHRHMFRIVAELPTKSGSDLLMMSAPLPLPLPLPAHLIIRLELARSTKV